MRPLIQERVHCDADKKCPNTEGPKSSSSSDTRLIPATWDQTRPKLFRRFPEFKRLKFFPYWHFKRLDEAGTRQESFWCETCCLKLIDPDGARLADLVRGENPCRNVTGSYPSPGKSCWGYVNGYLQIIMLGMTPPLLAHVKNSRVRGIHYES